MSRLSFALAVLFLLLSNCTRATAADPEMKFEVYKDKAGEHRWRLMADSGTMLATDVKGCKEMADAKACVDTVMMSGSDESLHYEVYGDDKKEYRWRLKSNTGKVIAEAGEAYKKKTDADRAVDAMRAKVAKATVVVVKD